MLDAAALTARADTFHTVAPYTERGPWLIARDDLPASGGAHATPTAPGPVIAALALTDPTA
jgi:hypothetical protein